MSADVIRADILAALRHGDLTLTELCGRTGRYIMIDEVYCNDVHLSSGGTTLISCVPIDGKQRVIVGGEVIGYLRCQHTSERRLVELDVLLILRQLVAEGLVERAHKNQYPWRNGLYWHLVGPIQLEMLKP